ncbi:MAG: hypothetical protein E7773_06805 [Sphingomonas sp.]|uniref:hypothetical protein n=1 Tax=Sphingomonas sp. TaxID=28214 RepID=UPI001202ED89|nr:hypothetical protein [Sphingomonas sp.]THD36704.1 MAG: hypothetical protein E7773_06805 [Sphingomonas sp.]
MSKALPKSGSALSLGRDSNGRLRPVFALSMEGVMDNLPVSESRLGPSRKREWGKAGKLILAIGVGYLAFTWLIMTLSPAPDPNQLSEIEKSVAADIAREEHIPLASAEARVREARGSADDLLRRQRENARRRDETDALRTSVCEIDPSSPRCP